MYTISDGEKLLQLMKCLLIILFCHTICTVMYNFSINNNNNNPFNDPSYKTNGVSCYQKVIH